METNQKDVILDIKVQYQDAIKGIAEYTLKIEEIKKIQSDLRKQLDENSISENEYAKSMAATKAEIDFNKKAVQTLNKEIQNNLKIEREQKGSIDSMKASLSNLTAQYNALSEEERNATKGNELNKQISETTEKLKALEEAHGNHHRSVGEYEKATRSLRTELRDITQQLAQMTLEGREGSEEFEELRKQAGMMRDAMDDANQSIRNTASDTQAFEGVNQGLQTLIGSYGMYQSALGLTDTENEKLAETMKNLQIVMAALSSATAIQNALQKESSLMTGIYNIQLKAKEKAEKLATATTGKATIAQKLFNTVANMNPYVLLGVALITVVGALAAFTLGMNKSSESSKNAEKALKNYEIQSKKTADAITQINNTDKNFATERTNKMREEILELKNKGATQKQISDAQMKAEQDIRDEQIKNSELRETELYHERTSIGIAIIRLKNQKKLSDEEQKTLQEKITQQENINQLIKEEIQLREGLVIESKEAIQQQKEQDKQRGQQAAQSAKERADKEREAIRQAEDSALAIVKENVEKQRQELNLSYDRQIEDLKRKLKEDKKLTETARASINQTIINLDKKRQQDLDKISNEEIAKNIENETKLIELRLQSVNEGTEQEYKLRLQQLAKQEEAELNNTGLTEEMKSAIREKYQKQFDNLETQRLSKTLENQKAAIDLEWRQRLDGVIQGSLEESNLKLQQAQSEYDALATMDAESKAAIYGTGLEADTAYTNALLDNKQKLRDAELENQKVLQDSATKQFEVMQTVGKGFEDLFNAIGEDNEAMAAFAKAIAIFNIGVDTAKAIASATASAKGITAIDYAIQVGSAIATVMANIAKAKQLLSKEKQPKAPKFATGGIVSGSGTGTSDSIVANLSRGESVLTASATSMFAPVLSALNQIGGGVPINVIQSTNQAIGEDMLSRAFAKGMLAMPTPIVSVQDINSVETRISVLENLRRPQ